MRAARLGVFFGPSTSFRLPSEVFIAGQRRQVRFPNEPGIPGAFLEVLVDDCYGITRVGYPIKTVLDVGANVGIFCLAAHNAWSAAVIHAYEPNARPERYLQVRSAAARCNYFLEVVTREGGRVQLDVRPDSMETRAQPDAGGDAPAVSVRPAIARLGGSSTF